MYNKCALKATTDIEEKKKGGEKMFMFPPQQHSFGKLKISLEIEVKIAKLRIQQNH